MADPFNVVNNLREAYYGLERRVLRAHYTMAGDSQQLEGEKAHALAFLSAVQANEHRFSLEEFACISNNIQAMMNVLDETANRLSDQPDSDTIPVVHRVKTGGRGRPKVEIDKGVLGEALILRGGPGSLALPFGCSSRTIRRRAIEYELVEPGHPVCTTERHADGSITRTYTSSTPAVSNITDQELDGMLFAILRTFQNFGLRMLRGRLLADGHRVPRERIKASFLRVNGAPNPFGHRDLHRQKYNVAGANSLWHHDGQHGLIRWKIVIHCFIDGKSRMVTAIRVSNNNRASTVEELFHEGTSLHGCPRRVRGDHGTENLRVAEWMEETFGIGSYIWGRSVHNTRIERLWYDVTHNFGKKWKDFFQKLEVYESLDHNSSGHLWLLHHLFHFYIDLDAQEWASAWNHHPLTLRNEPNRSPRDLFLFSHIQDGPRGVALRPVAPEEEVVEPALYGIDWEALEDSRIQDHFFQRQEQEEVYVMVEDPTVPSNLNHVPVEPPNCPFTEEQIQYLDGVLREEFQHTDRRDMEICRMIWRRAFEICTQFVLDAGRE
ncbi:hypothetical protein VNI00_004224 [Paramarasmius palmivorus]|uniref:Integrase core domain-containing protein n=1 Tax=Paramarasmius palmivorus TaxID=297713 RepID=A0AAW0DMZ4_9AGAR